MFCRIIFKTFFILAVMPGYALAQEKDCGKSSFWTLLDGLKSWHLPASPAHIAGPLHFVGTRGLSAWLITTSEGHILLNTGSINSAHLIQSSIRELPCNRNCGANCTNYQTTRCDPKHIKKILIGHAHFDHAGGIAEIQRNSGAIVYATREDAELLKNGGATDFHFADKFYAQFEKVDEKSIEEVADGKAITLGNITLTAFHTPGHTRGATTYTMKISDSGKEYSVIFPDGIGVNPLYNYVNNEKYPEIVRDYENTYKTLRKLREESKNLIWVSPHTYFFRFAEKLADANSRPERERADAWVDPEGFRCYVERDAASLRKRVMLQELRMSASRN